MEPASSRKNSLRGREVVMEAPMSSTLGSIGPLLRKLDSLLAPDGCRLPKVFKIRVESLKEDLLEDIVNPLVELSEAKAPDLMAMYWMTEVRELSYDIEDSIDQMMPPPAPAPRSRPNSRWRYRVGCAKIAGLPRIIKWSTRINKAAQLWLDLVREAIDRHERYLLEDDSSKPNTPFVFSAQPAASGGTSAAAPMLSMGYPKMQHATSGSGSRRRVWRHTKPAKHRTPVPPGRSETQSQEMYQQHDDSSINCQPEFPIPTRYEETSNLVGMDNTRKQLMNWIKCEDKKYLQVVSIVGPGGIGKTTVAKELYHEVGGQFMCCAFVRASRKPNMRKVLWEVLAQIQKHQGPTACNVQSLIDNIYGHLKDKRYFIVIDDLWQTNVWDIVVGAFPQSNNCSRILITTEIEDVALECSGSQSDFILNLKPLGNVDSTKLFKNIVFGSECQQSHKVLDEASYEITTKSGGLPLATTSVAGVARVSAIQHTELGTLSNIQSFLSNTLTGSGTKEMMKEILHFCYDSLPQHLKTCFLYLSIYPEGHIISKIDLVRQWIAEGFICTTLGKDKEEIAESYFNELINRRLIRPHHIKYIDGVMSCTVHHMVLDMIKCKSKESNFITLTEYPQIGAGLSTKVRRLSLQLSSTKHATKPTTSAMPQVRSLAYFGLHECLPLVASFEFKLIRVLTLDIWGEYKGCTSLDYTKVCALLHLRYVKISSNVIVQLPDEMAGLQQLETLEVDARVSLVPLDIIDLPRLSQLRIKDEIKLPDGIGRLRSLHTLQYFDLAHNSEVNVQNLGELSNLQDLHLACSTEASEGHLRRNLDALSISLSKLDHLCSLTLSTGASGAAVKIPLEGSIIMSYVPVCIKRLELLPQICNFSRLPESIGRLSKLRVLKISVKELLRNDIDRLNKLPALVALTLQVRVARVGTVVIQRASFPALRYFKHRSSLLSMVFRAGAMPKLECLKLGFTAQRGKQYGRMLGGVEHLGHLKEITGEITTATGASEADRRAAESAFNDTIEFCRQRWNAVSGHPRFPSVRVKLADWVVLEEEGHGHGGGAGVAAATESNLVCDNLPFPVHLLPDVISLTGPRDACRCSAVCTAFRAVASRDVVWDRFIPQDYRSILSRAVDPVDLDFASTKKELFTSLAEQHILIDEGNKSFWLDRTTGSKSYMLASKSLYIAWGDTPEYWTRIASPDSRFEEVSELIDVCWLDIIATIDCRELSLNTTYTAYLVFNLTNTPVGLDSKTQEASITIAGAVSARHTVSFNPRARSRRTRVGSRSHYWLQHHQWTDEDDDEKDNDGDIDVKEEEDDDTFTDDDEEDDEKDSDGDIDVKEDEEEDENVEMAEDDYNAELEEDEGDGNEQKGNGDQEHNVQLEEEESDNDVEEEEEENDFHPHSSLAFATDCRVKEMHLDIGGSSDESCSLEGEQEEDAVRYPRGRDDGWMEMEMGDFYSGYLDDGVIEIRLKDHTSHWKSGLIIDGVEIRPKIDCDRKAATS